MFKDHVMKDLANAAFFMLVFLHNLHKFLFIVTPRRFSESEFCIEKFFIAIFELISKLENDVYQY